MAVNIEQYLNDINAPDAGRQKVLNALKDGVDENTVRNAIFTNFGNTYGTMENQQPTPQELSTMPTMPVPDTFQKPQEPGYLQGIINAGKENWQQGQESTNKGMQMYNQGLQSGDYIKAGEGMLTNVASAIQGVLTPGAMAGKAIEPIITPVLGAIKTVGTTLDNIVYGPQATAEKEKALNEAINTAKGQLKTVTDKHPELLPIWDSVNNFFNLELAGALKNIGETALKKGGEIVATGIKQSGVLEPIANKLGEKAGKMEYRIAEEKAKIGQDIGVQTIKEIPKNEFDTRTTRDPITGEQIVKQTDWEGQQALEATRLVKEGKIKPNDFPEYQADAVTKDIQEKAAITAKELNPEDRYTVEDISAKMDTAKIELEKGLTQDLQKPFNNLYENFKQVITDTASKNKDGLLTNNDILELRQKFDQTAKDWKGSKIFEPKTKNAAAVTVKEFRDVLNDTIKEKNPQLKQQLKQQSALFRVRDVIESRKSLDLTLMEKLEKKLSRFGLKTGEAITAGGVGTLIGLKLGGPAILGITGGGLAIGGAIKGAKAFSVYIRPKIVNALRGLESALVEVPKSERLKMALESKIAEVKAFKKVTEQMVQDQISFDKSFDELIKTEAFKKAKTYQEQQALIHDELLKKGFNIGESFTTKKGEKPISNVIDKTKFKETVQKAFFVKQQENLQKEFQDRLGVKGTVGSAEMGK